MAADDWLDHFEAEQAQLRDQYGGLLDEVTSILYRIDPVGISYAEDEYEAEAVYILRRLLEATTDKDVERIVTDVLVAQSDAEWYGELKELRLRKRDEVAAEIWQAWQRRLAEAP